MCSEIISVSTFLVSVNFKYVRKLSARYEHVIGASLIKCLTPNGNPKGTKMYFDMPVLCMCAAVWSTSVFSAFMPIRM